MRLGETPLPIPNRTVKTQTAYDTWWETARESRTLPELKWPVGQAVKTPPFHGGNGGSIPPRIIYMAPWPSGKAKVCNTSIPGSNPGGALKPSLI